MVCRWPRQAAGTDGSAEAASAVLESLYDRSFCDVFKTVSGRLDQSLLTLYMLAVRSGGSSGHPPPSTVSGAGATFIRSAPEGGGRDNAESPDAASPPQVAPYHSTPP